MVKGKHLRIPVEQTQHLPFTCATGRNNILHLSFVSEYHSKILFHLHEANQSQTFVHFAHLAKDRVNSSLNVHPTQNSTTNVPFNHPAGANLNDTNFLVRDVNETVAICFR
ncbi:hypothetical protein Ddc_19552 [Ditylenchus destructor]|nr:hypothetical protein Ddc_19552 [Ditylenchus destructor]